MAEQTVWKYHLTGRETVLEMPVGAKVLSVQLQMLQPVLWALVEPGPPFEQRKFVVVGTGETLPVDPGEFVGTFQYNGPGGEPLVDHVFEAA